MLQSAYNVRVFVIYRNVDNVGNLVGHPGDVRRGDAE